MPNVGVGHVLHLDFKLSLAKDPPKAGKTMLARKKDSNAHEIWPKKRTAMNGFYHSPLPNRFCWELCLLLSL